jgi:hypothetical protein
MESEWSRDFFVFNVLREELHNCKYWIQEIILLLYFSVSLILFVLKYGSKF